MAENSVALDLSEPGEGKFGAVWAGRKITGVNLGKTPGRQEIVYDKRRELVAHQKPYWFKSLSDSGSPLGGQVTSCLHIYNNVSQKDELKPGT